MFCSECGTKLNENDQFCGNCGAALRAPRTVPATPTEPKKNNLVLIIAIIMGGILLVTIILGAIAVITSGVFSPAAPESIAVDVLPEYTIPVVDDSSNPIPKDNAYYGCYTEAEYILPESNTRYYAPAELSALTDQQLTVAAAEINARYGAYAPDPQLQAFFECLSWYTPGGTVKLNNFEKQNLFLIDVCQRQRNGTIYQSANAYIRYANQGSGYILPDSDYRNVTGTELSRLSMAELNLARNEIFARHGYIFQDEALQTYFYCQSWYVPTTPAPEFNSTSLNETENENLEMITLFEDLDDLRVPSSNNPYIPYYSRSYEYIFSDSNTRLLTSYDIQYLSIPQLIIARNEIFARNGYTFTDDHLMEYFLQCSWYLPQVPPGRRDMVSMNSTERKNVDLLLDYQNVLEELEKLNSLDTSLSYRVSSDFVQLTLPAYWKEYCDVVTQDNDLRFFEKRSHSSIGGGHLFSIQVVPYGEEIYHPSFDYLGNITDASGNCWTLVVYYPTDVQFDMPYAELYTKMYDEINRILNTLTLQDGYTYI